jgi:prepilin-type N-terminal cleavage/methylation domain-containing protein
MSASHSQHARRRHPANPAGPVAGFSLIELLVVIAIIGVLAAMTVPALPSMLGAKGVSQAVENTSGILELARTESMARKTYVYVAFLNATNAFGNSELRIGAVSSLDGSTNSDTNNLRAITKALKIDKTRMVKSAGELPANVRALATNATNFLSFPGPAFRVGNVDFSAADVITFSPNGEALPSADSLNFIPQLDIGLVPTKGTAPQTNDGAVVRYLGGSGSVQIFRP